MKKKIRYGKSIDSYELKKHLDKKSSIDRSKEASMSIKLGDEIESCSICSSKDRNYLESIYDYNYQECLYCGLVYVSSPPGEGPLSDLYHSEFYSFDVNKILRANDDIIDYRIKNIAYPKVEYVLENKTTSKKTWLDLGCGAGEILSVASKKGFKCLGIETNKINQDYAASKFGLKVVDGYINGSTLHKHVHKWGVISMFGVLEHLSNPTSILKSISEIQEKDDNLIIAVPHFPSIAAYSQLTFPDVVNRGMYPPCHLFLFSVKSLETLLNRYSYEITNIWFYGQDFYEFFSTFSIFIKNLNNSILHQKLLPLINKFQEVIDREKLSDEILVIATKTA